MTASFEEKNQQMEERIILVTRNLESPNYEELNDIMDMSMPFLPETSEYFMFHFHFVQHEIKSVVFSIYITLIPQT